MPNERVDPTGIEHTALGEARFLEVAAVGLVPVAGGVVVGCVADLVFGGVDEHLPVVMVDPVGHPAGSIRFLPKIHGPVSTTT